ncbi:hypothetical protein BDV18DRAFT_144646 [Aspergillus unguis]
MSYHTYTIVPFIRGLKALTNTLKKAEEHAKSTNVPVDSYADATLISDMKGLAFQIFIATNIATKAVYRAQGAEPPAQEDTDKTFADFYKRIDETIAALEKADQAVLAANEGKKFKFPLGPKEFEMTPVQYSTTFATPNFFFHVVTAYDILRAKGVPLGKMDYLSEFLNL